MVVRVKLAIKYMDKTLVTSALVNSGYEAERPEILLPLNLVRELGITRRGADILVSTPIGIGRLWEIDEVNVRVIVEDRGTPWIKAYATTCPDEREVLLSDYLTSLLKNSN